MSASSWQHLPGTAQLYLHRMMKVIWIFTGLAGRIDRSIFSNGVQFDASWAVNDSNILRGGFLFTVETATVNTNNQVFPVDAKGNQTSDVPFTIISNQRKTGSYYGFYLQDSWKVIEPLTINFGARFDVVDEYAHANQLSPRVSIVLQATKIQRSMPAMPVILPRLRSSLFSHKLLISLSAHPTSLRRCKTVRSNRKGRITSMLE